MIRRLIKDRAEHLIIVKPETLVACHRKGFDDVVRRKSKPPAAR